MNLQPYSTKMESVEPMELLPPAVIEFMRGSSTTRLHHAALRKLKSFKKFGFVKDFSPKHNFISEYSSTSSKWTALIKEEIKILQKDLPDSSILVRVCESRLDLVRAVIVGAEGTPYHNGLFFFDIHFPSSYPNVAPLVYCHVDDYRKLNPLFESTSTLSLARIQTWHKSGKKCWVPGVTNILDVLLGIEGEVFNAMPFYYQFHEGRLNTPQEEESLAKLYNDNTFTLSLIMMGHTMKKPPQDFEDFVFGHFVDRAHESCKTFIEDGAGRVVAEDPEDIC